jgi:hypothetical protein
MRFEITHRGGTAHVVELAGTVAVLGRDPGCDVVLNDAKCSRRHAVVEDLPEGLAVRDSGSANGTYVNGKRVEKAHLRPGDTIRLGDAQIKVLVEVGETVVVAPEDLDLRTSPPAPAPLPGSPEPSAPFVPSPAAPAALAASSDLPPSAAPSPPRAGPAAARAARPAPPPAAHRPTGSPREAPRPPAAGDPRRTTASGRRAPRRPATVSVLVGLWALFVPASVVAALAAASRLGGGLLAWGLAAAASVGLAGLGAAMALGLRALAPWARQLQVVIAGLGLLACPFTLASATVLLYLTRPEVRAVFESTGPRAAAANGTAEATFAVSLVAMLVLGLALTALAVLLL